MTVLEPVIAWLIKRKRTKVTLARVMAGADRPRRQVLVVMNKLVREGYLEEIADTPVERRYRQLGHDKRNPTWRVLSKQLSMPTIKINKPTLRDKMWKAIRMKRCFTFAQIQLLTGCQRNSVRNFVKLLERDGYVRKTGRDSHRVTWMLISGHNQVERPAMKGKLDE